LSYILNTSMNIFFYVLSIKKFFKVKTPISIYFEGTTEQMITLTNQYRIWTSNHMYKLLLLSNYTFIKDINIHLIFVGLNTFFVLIFVVFVADGPHFDRMFKMILIFIECLKWSSFSEFVFYLVIFCDAV